MSLLKAKKLGLLAASVGLLAMVAAQGCGSSDEQASPTAGSSAGGKSGAGTGGKGSAGTAGKNSSGGATGGGDVNEGGTGNETSMGGDANEGGMGGEPGTACDGPDGCYSCTPTTNKQFLNHCVAGGCPASFDNSTLTKLNKVGTL